MWWKREMINISYSLGTNCHSGEAAFDPLTLLLLVFQEISANQKPDEKEVELRGCEE